MNWATIWAAVSAIVTFITALIALWAMLRWRKQDELKVKLNFKLSIANYSFQLTQMPNFLIGPAVRSENSEKAIKLNELLSICNNSWYMCEGLLKNNKSVNTAWEFIFNNNKEYLNGTLDSEELGAMCMAIMHEKFVFD
jgi:hypothetical protein